MSRHLATLAVLSLLAPALSAQTAGADGATNPWFPETSIDLGTHLEGEVAEGEFSFQNSTDAALLIKNIQPSCTCSSTMFRVGDRRYTVVNEPSPNTIVRLLDAKDESKREVVKSISIGPGEGGKVEVKLDLRGISGKKEATLTLTTSDDANRMVVLKAVAVATQFFLVVPNEINLNKMNWQEKRDFTAQISSPLEADFEILGHDDLPDQMTVTYEKEMRNDRAVWIVRGTYGPNVDPRAGGGIINLRTDVQGKKVALRIMAFVEGPLQMKPGGFLALGLIKSGKGMTKSVEIEPTDDFDLQVEKIEIKNLSVDSQFVTAEAKKDGKVCTVVLTISPEVPRKLVRGDLLIHLNHPAAKLKEVQFNGFVR